MVCNNWEIYVNRTPGGKDFFAGKFSAPVKAVDGRIPQRPDSFRNNICGCPCFECNPAAVPRQRPYHAQTVQEKSGSFCFEAWQKGKSFFARIFDASYNIFGADKKGRQKHRKVQGNAALFCTKSTAKFADGITASLEVGSLKNVVRQSSYPIPSIDSIFKVSAGFLGRVQIDGQGFFAYTESKAMQRRRGL